MLAFSAAADLLYLRHLHIITKVCIYIHMSCKYQALGIAGRKNTFYLFATCMVYHIGNEHRVGFIKAFRQLKMKTNIHESLQAN